MSSIENNRNMYLKCSCVLVNQGSLRRAGGVFIIHAWSAPVSCYSCNSSGIEPTTQDDELLVLAWCVHVERILHQSSIKLIYLTERVQTYWTNRKFKRKKAPEWADQPWGSAQQRYKRSAGRCSVMCGIYQRPKTQLTQNSLTFYSITEGTNLPLVFHPACIARYL